MFKSILIFFLCIGYSFPIQVELLKDDGSFESSLATSNDVGIGQIFTMPSSSSLISAKIYLQAHTSILTVYVYGKDDLITTLGIVSLTNPVNGWNLVSLSNIQLPSILPPEIIVVARNSGSIGEDLTPPDHQHYRIQYYPLYNLFYIDPFNVGVRLIINNSPPEVEPASLGQIKAVYSK